MTLNIIDRRCTVNVQPTPQGYAFQYRGKTYRCSNQETLHDFFLKQTSFDTIKLRFPNQKYYLHFTLDEPEKFTTKKDLRRMLSKESQGAWIEEKNDKQRYFVDKGWVFSKIEELSEEEFFSYQTSNLAQKVVSLIGTVALGVLALGSQIPRRSNHVSSVGFVSGSLFQTVGVFAQMPVGGEFMVNTNVTGVQESPKTARLEGGGFVTVWEGRQTGNSDIYAKIFNATGGPIGAEFRCNTNVTRYQLNPAVAELLGGGFVVVWASDQTGDYDIYAQIYNTTLRPVGPEFRCNTNMTGGQYNPVVAGLLGGGFVVVWGGDQTGDFDIYAQIFNATRGAVGPEFLCNTNVTGTQSNPAVAGLMGGGFVTVWYGDQTGDLDIYAQMFNAARRAVGPEFRCNTILTGGQYDPAVTGLIGGGFVIVWYSDRTGDMDSYAQIYNATAGPIGSEFRCNTNKTSAQSNPSVIGLPVGFFVTVWGGSQTGNTDIYGQIYNATGGPIGSEFRCNTNMTGNQLYPVVTWLQDGDFVTVWYGDQTGNFDIYGQRYTVNFSQFFTDSPSLLTTVTSPSSTPQANSLTQDFSSISSSNSISSISTSLPTTVLVSSSSSPLPSATFPSITTLSYETTYSITANGLNIGSFIFQGGTGLIDGTQSNTIMLNIDTGLVGETFTLFTIPAGQEGEFETIELVGQSCQSFESQIVQDGASQAFQVIFQATTCALAAKPAAEFFPIGMLRV